MRILKLLWQLLFSCCGFSFAVEVNVGNDNSTGMWHIVCSIFTFFFISERLLSGYNETSPWYLRVLVKQKMHIKGSVVVEKLTPMVNVKEALFYCLFVCQNCLILKYQKSIFKLKSCNGKSNLWLNKWLQWVYPMNNLLKIWENATEMDWFSFLLKPCTKKFLWTEFSTMTFTLKELNTQM